MNLTHKELRHPVKFLINLNLDNQLMAENWQERYFCFAQIIPMHNAGFSPIDNTSFGHVNIEHLSLFKIRFTRNINIKMRIEFNNRYFEIKKITNLFEANKVMEIIGMEII